jgi:hypothetical protein
MTFGTSKCLRNSALENVILGAQLKQVKGQKQPVYFYCLPQKVLQILSTPQDGEQGLSNDNVQEREQV